MNLKKHAGNTLFILLARASELAAGLITVPLAARYLGPEQFGAYSFVAMVAFAAAPFIALGCARILMRDIAVTPEKSSSLTVSAVFVNLSMAGIAFLVMQGVLWVMDLRTPLAMAAGVAAVLWQSLLIVRQTLGTVAMAREAMQYEAILAATSRAILVLGFAVVAVAGLRYPFFFVAACIAEGMSLLLVLTWVLPFFTALDWSVRAREISYIVRESAPVAAYNFLGQSGLYVNVLLLKCLCDLSDVAFFQAPQRIIGPLMVLPMALLFAFTPALSRMGSDSSRAAQLRKSYRVVLRLLLFVGLPVCVLSASHSRFITHLLFGSDFLPSAPSFGILFWAIIPFSLNALLNTILTALGKQRSVVWMHIIAFGVNVLCAPWLIRAYGHVGASIAFLGGVVCLFLLNQRLLARCIGRLETWDGAWRLLCAAAGMGAVARVLQPYGSLFSVSGSLLAYGAFSLGLRAVRLSEIRAFCLLPNGLLREWLSRRVE